MMRDDDAVSFSKLRDSSASDIRYVDERWSKYTDFPGDSVRTMETLPMNEGRRPGMEVAERIFETYKVASGTNLRFQTRSIMNFIDFEMSRVISSYDGYEVDLWPSCRFHLYAGMLCTYACVVMERLFRGVHDVYQAAIFAENRCFHEQRTLSLLNDVFRRNARIAINAIDIDYEKIFKMGESQFFKNHLDANKWKKLTTIRAETCWGGCCRARTPWRVRSEEASIELMAIAYRAKAMVCVNSSDESPFHVPFR
ncbi:unnamed protein product [Nippostrongylus brasiliensis]|uniref:Protein FAR1-RELATED SEQUENCE n=1 Tax=Nippostrongylus brasiliensis TaxID=27835 RepID=A0A0N4XG32_NIPBR|nr:unnamed protein product [Nippostrongylus brasiliensis]